MIYPQFKCKQRVHIIKLISINIVIYTFKYILYYSGITYNRQLKYIYIAPSVGFLSNVLSNAMKFIDYM